MGRHGKGKLQPLSAKSVAYVLVVTCLIVALFGLAVGFAAEADLNGFEPVAESDSLVLYLNETTVEFAVLQKATGEVWYSNPYDRQRKETVAGGTNKTMLNSQLVLTYFLANRQAQMDTYNDSVVHGQYSIHRIPNGFRIDYQIGKKWNDEDYLPLVISQARFNELILDRIESARDRRFIESIYVVVELEKGYVDPDGFSILNVDLDKLLGEYGFKVAGNLRVQDRRRVFQEYLVKIRDAQKYTGLDQVTAEDISALIDTPTMMLRWDLKQWDKEDAAALMKAVGYTPDEAAFDHEMYRITPPYPDLRQFEVSVEYVLDGDDFVARILGESIVYPNRVFDPATEKPVTYPLTSISLLNYFGASDVDSQGYIMIPDGSGALIFTNNEKTTAAPYNRRVYGRDYASTPNPELSTVDFAQIHLPVFGLKDNDRAFLAIIEEGDAMARIEATVAKMRDSFNKVWASFDVIPQARVFLEAEGALIHLRSLSLNMYQSRPFQRDMVVRYKFLTGDDATYVGMARTYQRYLVERHGLNRIQPEDKLPFILEIVGAIDRIRPVMGIPSNVIEPMTTYTQAQSIVTDLIRRGVENIAVRYLGWMKGGVNHVYPSSVSLEGKVGDARQLNEFAQFLSARRIPLYPDISVALVRRDRMTDGFVGFMHASRFLNRNQAFMNTYNVATYQAINQRRLPLLSPSRYESVIQGFASDYQKLGIGGLSLEDLGRLLYSDFRVDPRELVDRQQALDIIVDQMGYLTALDLDLMIDQANAYVLPFTDVAVNAPLASRGTPIIDRSIPFYQMVLSGYVKYAAPAINLADMTGRRMILKMLETGSAPSFTVSSASSSEVKHTNHDHLFSISYGDLADDIEVMYAEMAGVLSSLWYQQIVDHECVTADLCKTTWEDGTSVFVNYGSSDDDTMGVLVPALGYVVTKGGAMSEEA